MYIKLNKPLVFPNSFYPKRDETLEMWSNRMLRYEKCLVCDIPSTAWVCHKHNHLWHRFRFESNMTETHITTWKTIYDYYYKLVYGNVY